jgi:hypothetical protein
LQETNLRQGPEPTRFVGLDIHRSYAAVVAVDAKQQVVLTVRRIDYEHFEEWIRKHLRPTDAVTLESTGNAWYFYDLLAPLVGSVTVANPIQVALIAKARVKTDPRDALTLARLLAAGLLPSVGAARSSAGTAGFSSPSPAARQTADPGTQSAAGCADQAQPCCSGH